MAFTLAQLEALEAAIVGGRRSVSYEGKSVSYGSLDEMLRIRALMRFELGLSSSRKRMILAAHSRGINGGPEE